MVARPEAIPADRQHHSTGGGPDGTVTLAIDTSPTDPTPAMRSPLVELDDVSMVFQTRKGFFRSGQVRAVQGVSFAIRHGETLAIVGESGSGKTTVGRLSLRLLRPTAGQIRFDGRDVTRLNDEQLGWLRRRAQIVFQDPFSSLNPYMRVADLVAEPLVIDGVHDRAERRQRVDQALEAVDLLPATRVGQKYPTTMSGGQRQRVGIARALVRNPEYIVADEPVSMIDASSRIEILDLLRGLQTGRGVAFLYITHDIASARHFADRIAVMYLGSVVEVGVAATVIDHPLHPYTQALIAAVPEPDPANRFRRRAVGALDIVRAGGGTNDAAPVHPGCPHRGRGDLGERPHLLAAVDDPDHLVACHLPPAAVSGTQGR
jgi:peptide/nickel transport system ATP-binding protein